MTQEPRTGKIETIVVTVNDRVLDCVSFPQKTSAEAYKRGVRSWALRHGLMVRVWAQPMTADSSDAYLAAGLALAS